MHQRFIPALCKSGLNGSCDATVDCTGEFVCDDATNQCTESCHTFISMEIVVQIILGMLHVRVIHTHPLQSQRWRRLWW